MSEETVNAEKLEVVTTARRDLSTAFIEQTTGLREDVNEVTERILERVYDAGASKAASLLEKYAPRHYSISHLQQCPACQAWWPRHEKECEIGEILSATLRRKEGAE